MKTLVLCAAQFLSIHQAASLGSEETIPLQDKVSRSDLVAVGTVTNVTLGKIRTLNKWYYSERIQDTIINFRIEECILGKEKQDIVVEAHSVAFQEGNTSHASTAGFANYEVKPGKRFVAYLKKVGDRYELAGESNQFFERIDDEAKTVADEGQTRKMVPLDWKKQQLRELVLKRGAVKEHPDNPTNGNQLPLTCA